MIVTVTPNPSIDRTVTLPSPLTRGAVHRVSSVTSQAGGKGVNVARALTLAGVDAVALLPAATNDPLLSALQSLGVSYRAVATIEPARNVTITVRLPDFLQKVSGFEATENGVAAFPCTVEDGKALLKVDAIESGRVFVLRRAE